MSFSELLLTGRCGSLEDNSWHHVHGCSIKRWQFISCLICCCISESPIDFDMVSKNEKKQTKTQKAEVPARRLRGTSLTAAHLPNQSIARVVAHFSLAVEGSKVDESFSKAGAAQPAHFPGSLTFRPATIKTWVWGMESISD